MSRAITGLARPANGHGPVDGRGSAIGTRVTPMIATDPSTAAGQPTATPSGPAGTREPSFNNIHHAGTYMYIMRDQQHVGRHGTRIRHPRGWQGGSSGLFFERWHGMSVRQGADCEADVGARKGAHLTAWAGRPDVGVHISGNLGARRVTFEYQTGGYSIFNIQYQSGGYSMFKCENLPE